MHSKLPMHTSPRCGAKTRHGTPCQSPAIRGKKRCRMHGGTSPGAPKRNRNAHKHGLYGREGITQRKAIRELLKQNSHILEELT